MIKITLVLLRILNYSSLNIVNIKINFQQGSSSFNQVVVFPIKVIKFLSKKRIMYIIIDDNLFPSWKREWRFDSRECAVSYFYCRFCNKIRLVIKNKISTGYLQTHLSNLLLILPSFVFVSTAR